jgi:hypothetical protein
MNIISKTKKYKRAYDVMEAIGLRLSMSIETCMFESPIWSRTNLYMITTRYVSNRYIAALSICIRSLMKTKPSSEMTETSDTQQIIQFNKSIVDNSMIYLIIIM